MSANLRLVYVAFQFVAQFNGPLNSIGEQIVQIYLFSRGGGGGTCMKGAGMLRGVNFEFWSHLGCSGQNTIIFGCEGLI